jgi:hypothetical protein
MRFDPGPATNWGIRPGLRLPSAPATRCHRHPRPRFVRYCLSSWGPLGRIPQGQTQPGLRSATTPFGTVGVHHHDRVMRHAREGIVAYETIARWRIRREDPGANHLKPASRLRHGWNFGHAVPCRDGTPRSSCRGANLDFRTRLSCRPFPGFVRCPPAARRSYTRPQPARASAETIFHWVLLPERSAPRSFSPPKRSACLREFAPAR